jgi:LPS export ABC transporter protein LptC
LINAHYFQTNASGQQEAILFSPYVTHYSHQDASYFKKPRIIFYKKGGEWHITANKARGVNGATTFYLYDHVKVRQLPSEKNSETLLTTESLTVLPKQNLVFTKAFVTIERAGAKISAVGLRGDLEKETIQLLSRAKGYYDPKLSNIPKAIGFSARR